MSDKRTVAKDQLEGLFSSIGLLESEREVYLAVLQSGKVSPTRVATLTGINRTTVYSIARKLERAGLITQDAGQKVSYLVAEPPEKILSLLNEEEQRLKKKRLAATELVKQLSSLSVEKQYSVPRIRFVEESDLSAYLLDSFTRWQKSALLRGNVWWGYQDDSFFEHYQEWIRWAWKQDDCVETHLFVHDISPTADVQQRYGARRHIKELPTGTDFDSGLWIVGDYTIMIQTKVRPHYLVEIHDEVFSRNQRELFKGLWLLAPEYTFASAKEKL